MKTVDTKLISESTLKIGSKNHNNIRVLADRGAKESLGMDLSRYIDQVMFDESFLQKLHDYVVSRKLSIHQAADVVIDAAKHAKSGDPNYASVIKESKKKKSLQTLIRECLTEVITETEELKAKLADLYKQRVAIERGSDRYSAEDRKKLAAIDAEMNKIRQSLPKPARPERPQFRKISSVTKDNRISGNPFLSDKEKEVAKDLEDKGQLDFFKNLKEGKIDTNSIPKMGEEDLINLIRRVVNKILTNKLGLGVDDLPDTVMYSDHVYEGMTWEDMVENAKEIARDLIEEAGGGEGELYEKQESDTTPKHDEALATRFMATTKAELASWDKATVSIALKYFVARALDITIDDLPDEIDYSAYVRRGSSAAEFRDAIKTVLLVIKNKVPKK
jgi:hypothetical protein